MTCLLIRLAAEQYCSHPGAAATSNLAALRGEFRLTGRGYRWQQMAVIDGSPSGRPLVGVQSSILRPITEGGRVPQWSNGSD